LRRSDDTSPIRHYSGYGKATDEAGDPGMLKGFGDTVVESGLQIQLQEDGGGSIRHIWVETVVCGRIGSDKEYVT